MMSKTSAHVQRLVPALLGGFVLVAFVFVMALLSSAQQPASVQAMPPLENSDLDGNGVIDHQDFRLLISVWHGLATPVPSATPTPTEMPTNTPTPVPDYVVDGFWVGNFTEYFSDPANHPVNRTGQFLWHLKHSGSQVTGTGDDTQYPLTISAQFENGLMRGTLKSFTTFQIWAVQDIPASVTSGYVPKFEGFMWGSKDGRNYDASFTVNRSSVRPTLAPTKTPTPTRSATRTPDRTFSPTRTVTRTPTPTDEF